MEETFQIKWLVSFRCQKESRREGFTGSSNEEDLRGVINRLGEDRWEGQYKTRTQTLSQSGIRESGEPYPRRTDPNEHRKWRRNCNTGSSQTREREPGLRDRTGEDRAYRQMMSWISNDPTRLTNARKRWQDRWKECPAEAVKNPVFPFFVSMTCK